MKLNKKMLFCATLLGGAVLGVEAFTAPTINPFYQCFPNDPCPAGTYSANGECKQCAEGKWSDGTSECTQGALNNTPEQILADQSYYFEKGNYYKVVIYGAMGGGGGAGCHAGDVGWYADGSSKPMGKGGSGGKSKKYTFYVKGNGSNGTIVIGKAGTRGGSYYDGKATEGGNGGDTYLTYSGVTYKVTGSSGGEGALWDNPPKPCDEYEGGRTTGWCADRPFSKCIKSTYSYSGGCSATYSNTEITDSSCDWRKDNRPSGDTVAENKGLCDWAGNCPSCKDMAEDGRLGYLEIYKWK